MLLLMLKKKKKIAITQLTENHWWNVNLSILESSCYNRSEYILVLAVSLFWLPWLKIFFPSLQHGMATMHAGPKAYLLMIITVPCTSKCVGTLLAFNSMCTCKLSSRHQTSNVFYVYLPKSSKESHGSSAHKNFLTQAQVPFSIISNHLDSVLTIFTPTSYMKCSFTYGFMVWYSTAMQSLLVLSILQNEHQTKTGCYPQSLTLMCLLKEWLPTGHCYSGKTLWKKKTRFSERFIQLLVIQELRSRLFLQITSFFFLMYCLFW